MNKVDLDAPATQAQIGALIGVTQQAISDMQSRGVMAPGLSLHAAVIAYCNHIRGVAAGRGSDGDLARERAELTRVQRERQQIKLALEQSEAAPVGTIEQVLASVGRTIAGQLEPLAGEIHKLCPALTPEALVRVQRAVAEACDRAVAVSLDLLVEPDPAEADGDSEGRQVPEDDGGFPDDDT